MTTEQFRAEYHLLDRVSAGAVETHHAQTAAGVMVMVHFLHGTETQNATILERIERLETARRQKVLRIVDVDGVTSVVTRFILDLTSFEEWLGVEITAAGLGSPDTPRVEASAGSEASATLGPPPAGSSVPESDDAGPSRSEPGEFTVAFRTLAQPRDPAPPAAPAPDEATEPAPDPLATSPEPKPSAGPRESESAEFGRLFAMPGRPPSAPRQSVPAPGTAGSPPPVASSPPSTTPTPPTPPAGGAMPLAEPTPSPLDPPPPAAPRPPPAADPPRVAPAPPAASPPPAPLYPPQGPPAPGIGSLRRSKPSGPGGYTRLINPQPMPEPPSRGDGSPAFPGPGADQRTGPPGAADRLRYGVDSYRDRLAAPPPDASPPRPPPAAPLPPTPVAPAGPGEYTKVIESMPPPGVGPPQRPPPPAAPPPPAPKRPLASSNLLFIGLLGVLLAAIFFVVTFAILT